jgi:hypothetical protein
MTLIGSSIEKRKVAGTIPILLSPRLSEDCTLRNEMSAES